MREEAVKVKEWFFIEIRMSREGEMRVSTRSKEIKSRESYKRELEEGEVGKEMENKAKQWGR